MAPSTPSAIFESLGCCSPLSGNALSETDAESIAAMFAVLADPVRLRLLSLVANQADGVCACDLVTVLDRSQPTISHHLKVLANAGLLDRDKRGRWVWYTVRKDRLAPLGDLFA